MGSLYPMEWNESLEESSPSPGSDPARDGWSATNPFVSCDIQRIAFVGTNRCLRGATFGSYSRSLYYERTSVLFLFIVV